MKDPIVEEVGRRKWSSILQLDLTGNKPRQKSAANYYGKLTVWLFCVLVEKKDKESSVSGTHNLLLFGIDLATYLVGLSCRGARGHTGKSFDLKLSLAVYLATKRYIVSDASHGTYQRQEHKPSERTLETLGTKRNDSVGHVREREPGKACAMALFARVYTLKYIYQINKAVCDYNLMHAQYMCVLYIGRIL